MPRTKIDYRDIGVRAFKTAVQTFVSVVALGAADVVNVETLKALLVAAGAAAVSATWNYIKESV